MKRIFIIISCIILTSYCGYAATTQKQNLPVKILQCSYSGLETGLTGYSQKEFTEIITFKIIGNEVYLDNRKEFKNLLLKKNYIY